MALQSSDDRGTAGIQAVTIRQPLKRHARTIDQSRVWLVKYHEDGAEYFGRHRSMLDRGERGHRIKQIEWRVAGARRRGFVPRSRVWKGAFRYTIDLTWLASPCRAGDIRSRPISREAGARQRQP